MRSAADRWRDALWGCVVAVILIAGSAGLFGGCGDERPEAPRGDEVKTRRPVADVLKDNAGRLMKVGGVVGVYEGRTETGEPCITVMVKSERPGLAKDIPSSLEGYPVLVEIGGEIRPMR